MKKILLSLYLVCNITILFAQLDAGSVMGLPTAATNAEMNAVTTAATGSIL